MQDYQHILLATDLGNTCEKTTSRAAEVAKKFGTKVTLLHVIEPLPAYGYSLYNTDIEAELLEEAKKQMIALGKKLDIPTDLQKIVVGLPKLDIIKVANDIKADLIIVGSRCSHGIAKILGSTATSVLHNADCDVLVVRQPN